MSEVEDRILDADTIKERHEYSIDVDINTIYLEGSWDSDEEDIASVSWVTARRFRKNLSILIESMIENGDTGAIVVDIDSPGGNEQAGMSIFDAIRACPFPIVGHVTGEASSMACAILQAFPDRVLEPHSAVMYHPGGAFADTAHPEFRAATDYLLSLGKKVDDVVYARMLEKNPALTRDQFDLMVMRGLYVDAPRAIELGLADRIATPAHPARPGK